MAGTYYTGLSVDFRFKSPRGREEAMVAGVVKAGPAAILEANDLELKTIKAFNVTPFLMAPTTGGPIQIYGSIMTPGSLMNKVTIQALYGSWSQLDAPAGGTGHLGTVAAIGTHKLSFFAVGA